MEAGKQNKLTCRECKVIKKIAAVGAWSQVPYPYIKTFTQDLHT